MKPNNLSTHCFAEDCNISNWIPSWMSKAGPAADMGKGGNRNLHYPHEARTEQTDCNAQESLNWHSDCSVHLDLDKAADSMNILWNVLYFNQQQQLHPHHVTQQPHQYESQGGQQQNRLPFVKECKQKYQQQQQQPQRKQEDPISFRWDSVQTESDPLSGSSIAITPNYPVITRHMDNVVIDNLRNVKRVEGTLILPSRSSFSRVSNKLFNYPAQKVSMSTASNNNLCLEANQENVRQSPPQVEAPELFNTQSELFYSFNDFSSNSHTNSIPGNKFCRNLVNSSSPMYNSEFGSSNQVKTKINNICKELQRTISAESNDRGEAWISNCNNKVPLTAQGRQTSNSFKDLDVSWQQQRKINTLNPSCSTLQETRPSRGYNQRWEHKRQPHQHQLVDDSNGTNGMPLNKRSNNVKHKAPLTPPHAPLSISHAATTCLVQLSPEIFSSILVESRGLLGRAFRLVDTAFGHIWKHTATNGFTEYNPKKLALILSNVLDDLVSTVNLLAPGYLDMISEERGNSLKKPSMLAHPDEFKNPSSFLKIYGDPQCTARASNSARPKKGKNGNWVCNSCHNVNYPRRFRCNNKKCKALRGSDGDRLVSDYARQTFHLYLMKQSNFPGIPSLASFEPSCGNSISDICNESRNQLNSLVSDESGNDGGGNDGSDAEQSSNSTFGENRKSDCKQQTKERDLSKSDGWY